MEDLPQVSEATSTKTAQTMMVLLQEVIHGGTGGTAAALNHPLGGKTGTTNDFTDAWFIGFSPSVTCGVLRVGYDNRQSLGEKETGAHAALPIWIQFMKAAIAGKENEVFAADDGRKPVPEKSLATSDKAPSGSGRLSGMAKPEAKAASPAPLH